MNPKEKVKEVLEKGHLMSLATLDDGGLWVADVIYIFDDSLNIYWMSDLDARHSKAIMDHKQVAGTITVSKRSKEKNLGIQFSGMAEKIDGPRFDLAKKHYAKRDRPEPKEKDDVLEGDSWYMLRPTLIDLIDEDNLGFRKVKIDKDL